MKNQYDYINNFNRQAYDKVTIMLPKGKKDHIKQIALQNGESINGLVNRLLKNVANVSDEEWRAKVV